MAGPKDDSIVSLVFLLSEPRPLNVEAVKAAAERAFAMRFALDDLEAENAVLPTDQPGLFVVKTGDHALGVISASEPYTRDKGGAADEARVFLLKRALQEHTAWLSVDMLGDAPTGGVEEAHRRIGMLLAEFAGDDCLALYSTVAGQMNSYGADLLPHLRSDDPLQALKQRRDDPTIHVSDDDPDMEAAVAEARLRWPEFVSAFQKRRPRQGFAVKVPFQDGEATEFMWVEVSRIDGRTISGTLVNEPDLVRNIELGDPVQIKLDDLNDWIYSDGERMVGGFTSRVLERR